MRPAIEVWEDAYRAWDDAPIVPTNIGNSDEYAAAVIEADRLAFLAEIVAELRDLDGIRDESNLIGWAANHIEAKFGGGSHGDR